MKSAIKFRPNLREFREQILQGSGTHDLLVDAMESAVGDSASVQSETTATRARITAEASASAEAATGVLSRALGRLSV